ncbi:HAD hydrolase-like protein [Clostridium sp. JNZ J1-5]
MKYNNFAVLFDMDGTLFQTEKIVAPALDKTYDHLRKIGKWEGETPVEKCLSVLGSTLPEIWKTLLPEESEDIRKEADKLFLKNLIIEIKGGRGQLYEGVIETLKEISEMGIQIFIASNGLEEYIDAVSKYYQLKRFVTDFYSSGKFKCSSKIQLIEMLLKNYNIQNAIMVGDRKSDIEAAVENNIWSIGCNFGFASSDELKDANYIVNKFNEIIPIVKSIHKNRI